MEFYDAVVKGFTNKGLWVRIDGMDEDVFIANSLIGPDSELYMRSELGDSGQLQAPEWWAERNGVE